MAAARAWPARQANVGTERVTGREGPAPGTARSHFFQRHFNHLAFVHFPLERM